MKKLTAVLTGSMFLLLGLFLFSFLPGIVHAQQSGSDFSKDITPTLNCPPGKFDSLMGVCKDTSKEKPATSMAAPITPTDTEPAAE
jgi:hypothetical protein